MKTVEDLITQAGATFSPCRRWRYLLWRRWGDGGAVNFIMLNPSTADEHNNDPTVERCQRRAVKLGYSAISVTNLFAWRATNPLELYSAEDPVGPDNDATICTTASASDLVICGWGNHGSYRGRSIAVADMLTLAGVRLHVLSITNTGEPGHPLYLGYGREPAPWRHPKAVAVDA